MSTTTPPRWLSVIPENIPRELTDAHAWYPAIIRPKAGKVGVWDKIPGDPTTGKPATWSDPDTRCSFDDVFMAYESGRFLGIGYMMDAGVGVIGIDLDHCISPDGTIAPWARAIVDTFPTYWEKSISGTGLRGFCRGTLPVGGCRSKIEGASVELYGDVRFLVVTGQALAYVDALPELQEAVDALHARLTSGRVRATGTAIGTGLTGRLDTVSPEALAILEAVMSGRHGARMADIWGRDDLHVAGASEDDWALASEIAYQGIRRGHTGAVLAQLVEAVMRVGPYRAKWDQKRGSSTWLAQDVANAIATVQKRRAARPAQPGDAPAPDPDAWLDAWPDDDRTPTDETPLQIIARLERELAAERTIRATQQVVIRTERAEATELKARLGDILSVLRNERLSPTSRIVAIVLGETVEQLRAHGHQRGEIMRADLARKAGVSEATITREMKQLCHDTRWPAINADAPIWKTVTTEWRDVDGIRLPTSRISIGCNTTAPVLAALATYQPPEMRTHGGSRVKGCPRSECEGADLIIRSTTHCAKCGDQIGETTESLRKQVDAVGDGTLSAVSGVNSGEQVAPVGGHDGEDLDERAAQTLPIPFEEARVRLLGEQDARVVPPSRAAPWRCACDCGCRAYERHPSHPRPGEVWRCDGCGHGPPAAVAGGAE